MRYLIFGGSLALLVLSACDTATGKLTPAGTTALAIGCTVDAFGVPLAKGAAGIASAVDPTIAPEVAVASALDQPVHTKVQDDCAALSAPPATP